MITRCWQTALSRSCLTLATKRPQCTHATGARATPVRTATLPVSPVALAGGTNRGTVRRSWLVRFASEDGGPVVLDPDHGPPVLGRLVERLLCSRRVSELALVRRRA